MQISLSSVLAKNGNILIHAWFRHWITHWLSYHQWVEFFGEYIECRGKQHSLPRQCQWTACFLLSFVGVQCWPLPGTGYRAGYGPWVFPVQSSLCSSMQHTAVPCAFCWAFSSSVLKITRHPLTFRIHFSTLKHHNSLFKETLGRVLTWSMLCRKESSFLLFFQHDFHWHDQAGKRLIGWQPRTAMQYL